MWTRFDKILFAFLLASIAAVLFTPYWYSVLNNLSPELADPMGSPTTYGIIFNYVLLFIIFLLIMW